MSGSYDEKKNKVVEHIREGAQGLLSGGARRAGWVEGLWRSVTSEPGTGKV